MCGRFTLAKDDIDEVAAALEAEVAAEDKEEHRPRYNVAPTDRCWILQRAESRRWLKRAVWGLGGRGPDRRLIINARAETATKQPRFREALRRRRCLVPADGFFEWFGAARRRRPLWYHRRDSGLLLLAGLYEEAGPEGAATFAILTTQANADVADVHDRMPLLISRQGTAEWLGEDDAEPPSALLAPAAAGLLVATEVSPRVNSVANDDPACLTPTGTGPERGNQGSLFS